MVIKCSLLCYMSVLLGSRFMFDTFMVPVLLGILTIVLPVRESVCIFGNKSVANGVRDQIAEDKCI